MKSESGSFCQNMEKKAEHNGRMLEILFHPGQVLREEISDEFSQEDAIAFHVSPGTGA